VNNVDLTSSGRLVAKGLSQFSRPDTSPPQREVADHLRIHFTSVSRILWAKDGNANKIDLTPKAFPKGVEFWLILLICQCIILTVKKIHSADMEKIITYFKIHGGYALMKELKAASFQTRDIARLLKEGTIIKVKPGLYRLVTLGDVVIRLPRIKGSGSTISQELIDVSKALPDGVICLASALAFYDLTTFNPSEIYVAIPNAAKVPKIDYPPLRVFYFRERFYKPGIEKIEVPNCTIRIYNKEKTICDMFRYRNKYGEDLALEGLKTYLSRKEANVNKLRKYAEICQVKTIMMPYLKALVRQ